jgi:TRAP-type C4-dicarboxylate transport system permease large subunit
MPTSHNMIIYSLAGEREGVDRLAHRAGVIPAIVLTLCMLVAAYAVAVKRGYPRRLPGLERGVALARGGDARAADHGDHPRGHPLGRLHGHRSRPRFAVVYSIFLTFFLYRTMTWEKFMKAAARAVKTTGVVLLLIGVSAMFQYLMALYQVADLAGERWRGLDQSLGDLLPDQLILFLLGTFMDMASTILICTPIFLPIAMQYGMDPVQFGMVMLINCALGLNTPPWARRSSSAARSAASRWAK